MGSVSPYVRGFVRCVYHGYFKGPELIFCPQCGTRVRHSARNSHRRFSA